MISGIIQDMNGHYYHNELKSQVCKAITALFIYLKKPPHTYITKHTNRDRNISYEWYGSMWLTRIRQTSDAYYQKDPIYKTEILALGTYIQVSALFWVGFIPNYKQLIQKGKVGNKMEGKNSHTN